MQLARKISGFPELTPKEHRAFLTCSQKVAKIFESYAYEPIETRCVEEVASLLADGTDVSKEIYEIGRIGGSSGGRNALHYDLTVPFARYLAMNLDNVVFPFKRYQMQKAWRGERPQEGRFREFLQCDVDVVNNEVLPLFYDVELPVLMLEALNVLGLGQVELKVNNRKVLEGFYTSIGVEDIASVLRVIDKIDKVGVPNIQQMLGEIPGLSGAQISKCIDLASIKTEDLSFVDDVLNLSEENELLAEGLEELAKAVSGIQKHLEMEHSTGSVRKISESHRVLADLSVARGLDYYTGIVFEASVSRWPNYPSICGGGRYENLVSRFVKKKIPGIGVSIGLTRIFMKMLSENELVFDSESVADLLFCRVEYNDDDLLLELSTRARSMGLRVDVYPEKTKLDKQIKYAARKGMRYVCMLFGQDKDKVTIRNLNSGVQEECGFGDWLSRLCTGSGNCLYRQTYVVREQQCGQISSD